MKIMRTWRAAACQRGNTMLDRPMISVKQPRVHVCVPTLAFQQWTAGAKYNFKKAGSARNLAHHMSRAYRQLSLQPIRNLTGHISCGTQSLKWPSISYFPYPRSILYIRQHRNRRCIENWVIKVRWGC